MQHSSVRLDLDWPTATIIGHMKRTVCIALVSIVVSVGCRPSEPVSTTTTSVAEIGTALTVERGEPDGAPFVCEDGVVVFIGSTAVGGSC